jgi:Flp pilus assembly protein TadG
MGIKSGSPDSSRGTAAVELAILLPLLCFFLLLAIDFGRVFYFEVAVADCARSGALYGSLDSTHAADSRGIMNAAKNAGQDLDQNLLVITSATGTDSGGAPCIDVTVSYPFYLFTQYLVLDKITVATKGRMRVAPRTPDFP